MRLVLFLILVLWTIPGHAFNGPRLSQRAALTERAPKQASSVPADHAWKLGLLGLAALSFLIRRRL